MIHDRMDSLTALTESALTAAHAGQRLLAAVSGGADSVCLLLCLSALREKTERFYTAEPDSREILLGQILFLCAELAQFFGTDSEVLLHDTVKTVIQRCKTLEKDGKNGSISPGILDF